MSIGDQLTHIVLTDAEQKITDAVAETLRATQDETPRGITRVLADTMRTEPVQSTGSGFTSAIEAPAPYAAAIDRGIPGGVLIVPRRAKVLHWTDGGGNHFAKRVTQGRIAAREFFSKPMPDRWRDALTRAFS